MTPWLETCPPDPLEREVHLLEAAICQRYAAAFNAANKQVEHGIIRVDLFDLVRDFALRQRQAVARELKPWLEHKQDCQKHQCGCPEPNTSIWICDKCPCTCGLTALREGLGVEPEATRRSE